ncbi:MAG: BON domain-containing protein [Thermoanaerobaculaceae bacterium]|nr:BON domain-containing protein [Thermoanaerobaculaceae bacterium]
MTGGARRRGGVRAVAGCAALGVALAAVGVRAAERATPTPAPGPAARVGGAIDHAWEQVTDSVGEALLVTRIRVALLDRIKEDGLRVSIVAHGGAVELSGAVKHRSSVELAPRAAAAVKGVSSVRSLVTLADGSQGPEPPVARVVGSVERTVADALLDARVKARLLEQLGKVAFRIDVDAAEGVVTISGTVPDAARRRLAVRVVTGTTGVTAVRDLLTVKE